MSTSIAPKARLFRTSLDVGEAVMPPTGGMTLANYAKLFGDTSCLGNLPETFVISLGVTLLTALADYPLAHLMWRASPGRRGVLTVVVLSPLLVSIVVSSFGWIAIPGNGGLIDPVLMEAAATLGAAPLAAIRHVALPLWCSSTCGSCHATGAGDAGRGTGMSGLAFRTPIAALMVFILTSSWWSRSPPSRPRGCPSSRRASGRWTGVAMPCARSFSWTRRSPASGWRCCRRPSRPRWRWGRQSWWCAAAGIRDIGPRLPGAHVLITFPCLLRTIAASLIRLDIRLEEAATTLGASPIRAFRHVTLPAIRPGAIAGGLFAFIVSFDNVPVSLFLTTVRYNTLPIAIMNYVEYNSDPSIAAISTMMILFSLTLAMAMERRLGIRRAMGG